MSNTEPSASAVYPRRLSKEISLAEAGQRIAARKTLSLVGSQVLNSPMALVREAIRAGAKNLTVIPSIDASVAVDLLIAAGCVETLFVSYVGFETLGLAPAFRAAAEGKRINIIEADEPFIMLGTRAAAGGMPFVPVKGVYEATALLNLNPMLKRVKDPYTGEELVTIPPLKADICIFHAQAADEYGNAQVWGGNLQEPDKVKAADHVIVSAERIVSVDETRRDPGKVTIPGHLVDAVVHAPFGAHPTLSPKQYREDVRHLEEYIELVRSGKAETYLERYVRGPGSLAEYLERVGISRIMSLQREV